MKNICFALSIFALASCGYQKEGASRWQIYDDYMGCSKEAQKQERILENQCMTKLGYQVK